MALGRLGNHPSMSKMGYTVPDLISSNPVFSLGQGASGALQNQPFLELLRRYRRSQCTGPRDKVYGLLGLSCLKNSKTQAWKSTTICR